MNSKRLELRSRMSIIRIAFLFADLGRLQPQCWSSVDRAPPRFLHIKPIGGSCLICHNLASLNAPEPLQKPVIQWLAPVWVRGKTENVIHCPFAREVDCRRKDRYQHESANRADKRLAAGYGRGPV